ncbi:hypothetical protein SAMN05216565_101368 [Litchfieldia salsa]|uniref:Uncharacterized protein n=1 Tax=Litchfieldia salsa TaxID=930152 RepID=A0A1H0PL15_9BACI|nr:hypothetical protein SAMN05216565_101368 [Litchfieldia salsa]
MANLLIQDWGITLEILTVKKSINISKLESKKRLDP